MRVVHPNSRKLQRWLDGEQTSIDRHLRTCAHCAQRLHPLVLDESDTAIGPALLDLLAAPGELPDRLQRNIDKHMSNLDELTLISELYALPIRAARAMSTTR